MRLTDPPHITPSTCIKVSRDQIEALAARGLHIVGAIEENEVFVAKSLDDVKGRMTIIFEGANNRVFIGPDQRFNGHVKFDGDGGQAELAGGTGQLSFNTTVYAGGRLEIGRDCNFFGVTAWVHGGARLSIGEDCLFSEPVHLRTSDHHSIIDLNTMSPINEPADIAIGAHVWLGPNVIVNKGARIGDGAIVGAGSLVNKNVPDRELWAGSPARRLRENVSWVASLPMIAEHLDTMMRRFELTPRPSYD